MEDEEECNSADSNVENSSTSPSARPRRQAHTQMSPWYQIPAENLVCIEHSAKVHNEGKAIKTLGGIDRISKEKKLELRLRPGDVTAPPVEALKVSTKDILLKITVPKLNKTKANKDVEMPKVDDLLSRLRASNGSTDFQWSSLDSKSVQAFKDSILSFDLNSIRNFELSPNTDPSPDADLVRPPNFSQIAIPQSYGFRQNANVVVDEVDGKVVLSNVHKAQHVANLYGDWDSNTVPEKPSPETANEKVTQECIDELKKVFEERPIVTRRVIRNMIPRRLWSSVKFALPQVSYSWKSGPWRDTCVKYGIDPRKEVQYAKYQVLAFKMDADKSVKAWKHNRSHIFDGKTIVKDGRIYQFCDITDPLLADLIKPQGPYMRAKPDKRDGWYQVNRIHKIKSICRSKLSAILEGKPISDASFTELLAEPDNVRVVKIGGARLKNSAQPNEDEDDDDDEEDEDDEEGDKGEQEDDDDDNIELTLDPTQMRDEAYRRQIKEYVRLEQGVEGMSDEDAADEDDEFELLE